MPPRQQPIISTIILVASGALTPALSARSGDLSHNISPGTVSTYKVRIETASLSGEEPNYKEHRQEQTGKLTRIIFSDKAEGKANCAQMLQLEAGKTIAPPTQPADRQQRADTPASQERVQFSVKQIDTQKAPFMVPAQTAWSRAMLGTVILVTDWPEPAVSAGDKWTRKFEIGEIAGELNFKVDAVETVESERQAVVKVNATTSSPTSSSGGSLISAESNVVWSLDEDNLVSLAGKVIYSEPVRAGGRMVKIDVKLTRTGKAGRLSKSRLTGERWSLVKLTEAIGAYNRNDAKSALRSLLQVKRRRIPSKFEPMADYLMKRIRSEQTSKEPLPVAELKKTLVSLLAMLDRADNDNNLAVRRRCQKSLQHVVQVNRPEIMRMLEDDEGTYRALGCFALAFGSAPADVALIEKCCSDADLQTRRMALYALALRASPHTDADTLLTALKDADNTVRVRACEALGRCVDKDSPELTAARAALVELLNDKSPAVVIAAAQTLSRIGSEAEMKKVKETADKSTSQELKSALERLTKPNDS